MKTTEEVLDLIHIKVHALRLISGYKPSQFEIDLNKIISEDYESICSECKDRINKIKNDPYEERKSFLRRLME